MIISADTIVNPRKSRDCDNCGELMIGSQIRLYGTANHIDKPYVLHLCHRCGRGPAVSDALICRGKNRWNKIRLAKGKTALP